MSAEENTAPTYNPHAISTYRATILQGSAITPATQREQQLALLRELIERIEERPELSPITSITFAYDHEYQTTTIQANF